MIGLLHHVHINLRLHFRNRMALIYGYLFPLIFLLTYWVLYRYERVPLSAHMGELLTLSVLGGACFGLPTSLVSERERGVWRRYRLLPIATADLVAGNLIARYILLISAGVLQLILALSIGMPMPLHLMDLLLAFTCASFAFLGLGLMIAALADTVPAVQALGQCIFLPMLIIGGVAVPLTALPEWAQHLSSYFPGRYAVAAMQSSVTGTGIGSMQFSLLALGLIGSGGYVSGIKLFRWDLGERSAARHKGWLVVTLATWVGAGLLAESRELITGSPPSAPAASNVLSPDSLLTKQSASSSSAQLRSTLVYEKSRVIAPAAEDVKTTSTPNIPAADKSSWQSVTRQTINEQLIFDQLPPDSGIVTPIASKGQEPSPDVINSLNRLQNSLDNWQPGKVPDLLQRVRNYLTIAAIVDVLQDPREPYLPLIIFTRLQQDIAMDDLIKILYWIAVNPDAGDDLSATQLQPLGIQAASDRREVHTRVGIYSVKLLGRLLNRIPTE